MKRVLWMALLALALPATSFANSVTFKNSGGTLKGNPHGFTLTGSELVSVDGLDGLGLVTGNLGTVSFTTNRIVSGNLQMGGVFAPGGTFKITGNGTGGIPNGVIFNGSFSGTVTWTLVTLSNGTHQYTLQGNISGTWFTGATVHGHTVELTINTGRGFFGGKRKLSAGETTISAVPEPGTLAFLGAGLVGIAGVMRQRMKT